MLQRVTCIAAVIIGLQPQLASAQEIPLSEVLVRVIQSEIVLAGPRAGSQFRRMPLTSCRVKTSS